MKLKDQLWKPTIDKAIDEYALYDFDVVHFESGMDFLKNEFFGPKETGKTHVILIRPKVLNIAKENQLK